MDSFCTTIGTDTWIVKVEQTCFGCPTVWDGTVERNGEKHDIYIRLRHGVIRVVLGNDVILTESVGGGVDGIMSWDEAKPYLAMALQRA